MIGVLLDCLPDGFRAVHAGRVDLVVGPTGVFAVTDGDPDLSTAARRAALAAGRARDRLSATLSWAPFVDALVVVDRLLGKADEATVVPRRHLRDVLGSGPAQLSDADVERIVLALG